MCMRVVHICTFYQLKKKKAWGKKRERERDDFSLIPLNTFFSFETNVHNRLDRFWQC